VPYFLVWGYYELLFWFNPALHRKKLGHWWGVEGTREKRTKQRSIFRTTLDQSGAL
jgi:hypothetical protein